MQNSQVFSAVDGPRRTLLSRAVSRITIVDAEGGNQLRKTTAATFARSRVPLAQGSRRLSQRVARRLLACAPSGRPPAPTSSRVIRGATLTPTSATATPARRNRPPVSNARTVRSRVADIGTRLRTLAASPTAEKRSALSTTQCRRCAPSDTYPCRTGVRYLRQRRANGDVALAWRTACESPDDSPGFPLNRP